MSDSVVWSWIARILGSVIVVILGFLLNFGMKQISDLRKEVSALNDKISALDSSMNGRVSELKGQVTAIAGASRDVVNVYVRNMERRVPPQRSGVTVFGGMAMPHELTKALEVFEGLAQSEAGSESEP